jgi:hypothetical protein
MVRSLTISALVLFTSFSTVLAQPDPDPDGIGIYFDEGATQISRTAEIGEDVTAYLIVTNPSLTGGIAMWGALVAASPYAFVHGSTTLGLNIATNMPGNPGYSFTVFCDTPLPQLENFLVLATLTITPVDDAAIDLFINEGSPDLPMYRLEDAYHGDNHFWYPISGSVDLPVARINGEAPVKSETATWSAVKATFR